MFDKTPICHMWKVLLISSLLDTDGWRRGTCGVTSWSPDSEDCICDDKGSIPLSGNATGNWRMASSACFAACYRCSRCTFVSVSIKWKDCSWFSDCNQFDVTSHAAADFRTFRVRSSRVFDRPPAARCMKSCGYHRDCPRNYKAADILRAAATWNPQNATHMSELAQRAVDMASVCARDGEGTAASQFGGWCLGPPLPIPQEEPGVMRSLPDNHIPADPGIVSGVLNVLRKPSGVLLSVNDFGAGVGQYGRELLAREPKLKYAGYDGAGNIVNRSNGFVQFFDLTLPLSLPRADWVLCLEVGEHVPHQHEAMLIRNLHVHNRRGVILSWAPLDRYGLNHVNNHNPVYVCQVFNELNYSVDRHLTERLRKHARHWIKDHIFVFRRIVGGI